ncbi:hypothetical protein [Geobacter pickeringii]|uniref:Lipoprotein n=1 Tax=Geobacter pickeringii TaxID=345632 RepID=A0A0B5BE78_9BACT|nr:hypothetical protein [Geobacter pickeringii]AJE02830.1 hypothetical protein GPICK_05145 [Geobacter pickeringii]
MSLFVRISRLSLPLLVMGAAACATVPPSATNGRELPPILAQDEIFRPYVKLGTVEVTRERFGAIDDLRNEADDWANEALETEAAKLGADAVILPEIRGEKSSYLFFPVTEIKAKGVAIKFR